MKQLSMFGEGELIPGAVMVGGDLLTQDELPVPAPLTDAERLAELEAGTLVLRMGIYERPDRDYSYLHRS